MDKNDLKLYLSYLDPDTDSIDLSNKDLDELPASIGKFTELEYLNLSYNNITKLPDEICKLENLKTLLLLRNDLEKLPDDLYKLKQLTVLDISYNPLKSLPKNIEQMVNLKSLDASYCQITRLPMEFTRLLSLKDVHLEENPFEFPPEKVIKRGLYATMYYLTEEKKKQSASKVIMQVYNLPKNVQIQFQRLVEGFNKVLSDENKNMFTFDISFVNPDFETEIIVDNEVETKIFNFVSIMNNAVENQKTNVATSNQQAGLAEVKLFELRSDIAKLNDSINEKVVEMKKIQNKLASFSKLLS